MFCVHPQARTPGNKLYAARIATAYPRLVHLELALVMVLDYICPVSHGKIEEWLSLETNYLLTLDSELQVLCMHP